MIGGLKELTPLTAWNGLLAFVSSSDWLFVLFGIVVIGSGLGFMMLDLKLLF